MINKKPFRWDNHRKGFFCDLGFNFALRFGQHRKDQFCIR